MSDGKGSSGRSVLVSSPCATEASASRQACIKPATKLPRSLNKPNLCVASLSSALVSKNWLDA
eukprot:2455947-Karenia_brevis.AAC.1